MKAGSHGLVPHKSLPKQLQADVGHLCRLQGVWDNCGSEKMLLRALSQEQHYRWDVSSLCGILRMFNKRQDGAVFGHVRLGCSRGTRKISDPGRESLFSSSISGPLSPEKALGYRLSVPSRRLPLKQGPKGSTWNLHFKHVSYVCQGWEGNSKECCAVLRGHEILLWDSTTGFTICPKPGQAAEWWKPAWVEGFRKEQKLPSVPTVLWSPPPSGSLRITGWLLWWFCLLKGVYSIVWGKY